MQLLETTLPSLVQCIANVQMITLSLTTTTMMIIITIVMKTQTKFTAVVVIIKV